MGDSRTMTMDHVYGADMGEVFMTGIQALVRLPLMQCRFDRLRGHNTAGLVSGYRGSPLGAYDQHLWKAQKHLSEHDVVFQPGLNEDLAATALWGAQMHRAYGATKADGVFGIWYGKGPGVDRCGDVFRNANMLGTSALGGVLAVAGDDHAAQSSMFPHQTDGIFQSTFIPILQPANVSEILSLGLAGFEMSRYSGLWVAMKTIAEVVESASTFSLPNPNPEFQAPLAPVPAHGLNWDPKLSWPAQRFELERRMIEERLPAAIRWAVANEIDRPVLGTKSPRLCIVTVGKAHQDLMQALDDLGIGEPEAAVLGLAVFKVAMSWPLACDPLIAFAGSAEEIFVIEEKTPIVENQVKAALFNGSGPRPRVTGKTDEAGKPLLPVIMELSPLMVARALVQRLPGNPIAMADRLAVLESRTNPQEPTSYPARKPYFCAGCPHNRSTRTPEGSISGGGIGCHALALSVPELKTNVFSHMGAEGVQWIGAAPFSQTGHIFQNLGDGTYQHSGVLAIRAAVAARTNITFKILFNDAVAMTGGQPAEGEMSPAGICAQLLAEGVTDVRLVSEHPFQGQALPAGVSVAHRDQLDSIQRELRTKPGVTAIVYDQTCAAEKRRRRKQQIAPDPDRRMFINSRVCEGCGDCSIQSSCIAIQPLPTPDGIKRQINQSACNKDFSCLDGFCPSFVEIEGATLRKPDGQNIRAREAAMTLDLPLPDIPQLDKDFNIYIAGIGGLGVLTTGALLGTAAYLDGKTASVLDFTGISQKNGSVVSQVRLAPAGTILHAVRIGDGQADLLIGCDAVVAVNADALRKCVTGCAAVLNTEETSTSDFVRQRDARLPMSDMIGKVLARAGERGFAFNATQITEGLFGNSLAANTLMLGYAWQEGLLPLSFSAIQGAIRANGAAVELNERAFLWGRLAAMQPAEVEKVAGCSEVAADLPDEALPALIARCQKHLEAYQSRAYAHRYATLMRDVLAATQRYGVKGDELARAIANGACKAMAYKDEYEVARLYAEPEFRQKLARQFAEPKRISVYLAPPFISKADRITGRARKRKFGPWIFRVFKVLAHGRRVRGTWADPFGYTAERRSERAFRDTYLADMERVIARLSPDRIDTALALALLPQEVRGFGPVKEAALHRFAQQREAILAAEQPGCSERIEEAS